METLRQTGKKVSQNGPAQEVAKANASLCCAAPKTSDAKGVARKNSYAVPVKSLCAVPAGEQLFGKGVCHQKH